MFNSKRFLVDLAILLSLFFLPWWMAAAIAVISCWFWDFYEIILVGFLIDVFYRSGYYFHIGTHYISYSFTLIAFLTLFALRKLKKRVRFSA